MRIRNLILGTCMLATTMATNLEAITRAEGERIVQNVLKDLFGNVIKCDKRLYYDGTELRFAAYLDQQLLNAAFLGLDYLADATETPENNLEFKENELYGAYYHNCTAEDSVSIRKEIINYLKGKVDPVIGTEKTSWGRIKSEYD